MLSEFFIYPRLDYEHITAFTVGQLLTLALATLRSGSVSTALVELSIPLTVKATCAVNGTTTPIPDRRPTAPGDRPAAVRPGRVSRNSLSPGSGPVGDTG